MIKRIAITPGEPASIGPDIVIKLAQQEWPAELVVCADPQLLIDRAKLLNLPLELRLYDAFKARPSSTGWHTNHLALYLSRTGRVWCTK